MATFNSADIAAFKDVWVFCEQRGGKLMPTDFELISEGRKLADELGVNLCGLLLGDNVEVIAMTMGVYLVISITTSVLMNIYNRRMTLVER
jgi:electron transfer flavoprotein alpha subunit